MIRTFIKNYEKNGKVTQIVKTLVYDKNNNVVESKKYFVNVSKKTNNVYLTEITE